MDNTLLSRITKDYLNLDPDLVGAKERYRMGWGGSVLAPHGQAKRDSEKRGAAKRLIDLKKNLLDLFQDGELAPPSMPPQLQAPVEPPSASFRPPWVFSKGALDQKKQSDPIPYLLIESHEIDTARPVPGKMMLLRSLCRGKGVVRQNSQGLIYLDVDNRFISMMLPYLKAQNLVRPPYFNLFGSPEGAHVPLITPRERGFHYLDVIEGLGTEISFDIEGLFSLQPASWPEVEQVWFFKLRSDGLENFRRNHFLPPLPGGNPFQITVALRPRSSIGQIKQPLPLMCVNKAFIAA